MDKQNKYQVPILLIVIVLFVIYNVYDELIKRPIVKEFNLEMETEFDSINVFPGSKLVNYVSRYKSETALVSATYIVKADNLKVFEYYENQLLIHGWKMKYRTLNYFFSNKQEDNIIFCKDNYSAEVYFADNPQNTKWNYSFSISYGINDCRGNNNKQ